jgi:hypothetical protein
MVRIIGSAVIGTTDIATQAGLCAAWLIGKYTDSLKLVMGNADHEQEGDWNLLLLPAVAHRATTVSLH